MSQIEFDRLSNLVRLLSSAGDPLAGPFEAHNNVDSHSRGPWPDGTYGYVGHNSHSALADPDSEYGSYGILIFDVPGRLGMGVHSGRRSIPDGLDRSGPAHCTLGCIRTTDEAMAAFVGAIQSDGLVRIAVGVAFEPARAQVIAMRTSGRPKRVRTAGTAGPRRPKSRRKAKGAAGRKP